MHRLGAGRVLRGADNPRAGQRQDVEDIVQKSLGVALIIAATGLFIRAYMRLAERAKHRDGSRAADPKGPPQLVLRRSRP